MSRLDENGNFTDIVGELRRVAQLNGELYSRRLMLNQAADEIDRLREQHTTANDNSARYSRELVELEEERDELRKAIDSIEIEHGLTSNGNLWRFWSAKAKGIAAKFVLLKAENDRLRSELANARNALEKIARHSTVSAMHDQDKAERLQEIARAALKAEGESR